MAVASFPVAKLILVEYHLSGIFNFLRVTPLFSCLFLSSILRDFRIVIVNFFKRFFFQKKITTVELLTTFNSTRVHLNLVVSYGLG